MWKIKFGKDGDEDNEGLRWKNLGRRERCEVNERLNFKRMEEKYKDDFKG